MARYYATESIDRLIDHENLFSIKVALKIKAKNEIVLGQLRRHYYFSWSVLEILF